MEHRQPHRALGLLLTSALVLVGCGRPDASSDVAWGTGVPLDGARNAIVYAVAEETGVPAEVLLALGFQQSRFEEPELLAEYGMDGEADVPDDLLDAEFPLDEERILDEADFEIEDDVSVPGYEALSEEAALDPEAMLTDEAPADPGDVDRPTDIDTTSEDPSLDEEGDPHPGLDAAGVFFLTSAQVTWAAEHMSADGPVDEADIRSDLEANTRAAAALLLGDLAVDGTTAETATHRRWEEAMVRFVGLDPDDEVGALMRTELHAILAEGFDHFTSDGERLLLIRAGVPLDGLDLSSPVVDDEPVAEGGTGDTSVTVEAVRGAYPPIQWIPASSSNYSSGRGGSRIRYVVIHDIEGTMSGAIAVFRNPRYAASAHYIVRARDGHIVRMVNESDRAWHAGHWLFNSSAIGIEHEGFANRPQGGGYYTDRLYRASAELTCAIARRYDIPVDRRHIVGHANVPRSRSSTTLCPDSRPCGGAGGHTDPGRYWNWGLYMRLVSQCVSGRDLPGGEAPRSRPPAARRAITTGWGGQRAVLDASGDLHVFAVDARNRLVENVRSGTAWSNWRVIASAMRGFPAATLAPSGELYVAVRGADDVVNVVRRDASGAWGSPTSLDGLTIDAMPVLFVNPDGRMEVFARGRDHAAWHAAEVAPGGSFGRWWSLGGALRSMVTVVANPDGAPHIFAIGDAVGHVFHRERTAPSTWTSWRYLAARGNTPVSPVRMPDGRLAVFLRNAEGRLVQQFTELDGRWRSPITVGGNITSNVVAALDSHGRVNVISRGRDGAVYRVVRNAGGRWGSFARLGGRATMGPVVVRSSVGLEVFVAGRNHALYHAHQARGPRSGWSGWHPHGGRLGWL